MKLRFILGFALMTLGECISAQTYHMVVKMNDGTTIRYAVDNIDCIDMEDVTDVEEASVHEAIDMGLSVKWATTNLGAEQPWEYGNLYSWGETSSKKDYSEDAYTYFSNSTYQSIGNNISGTSYDAASASWKDNWRMPTMQEVNELFEMCQWEACSVNTIKGYKVTGPSGNCIFLPAAGYSSGTTRKKDGEEGYYWTGTLNPSMTSSAYNLNFKGYNTSWGASRAYGFSIRPVKQ